MASARTIDFQFDAKNDVVVMHPRWYLDSAIEVRRWYDLQAGYFAGRFQQPKDVVVINDVFDVAPRFATLWGQYQASLHERFVHLSVSVNNNARVRLTTNTSVARYGIAAVEMPTVEAAMDAILASRRALLAECPAQRLTPQRTVVHPPSSTSMRALCTGSFALVRCSSETTPERVPLSSLPTSLGR